MHHALTDRKNMFSCYLIAFGKMKHPEKYVGLCALTSTTQVCSHPCGLRIYTLIFCD
jgi:hypothetical protein